eukprot:3872286-Alexandrium_andersonii.AAC.1
MSLSVSCQLFPRPPDSDSRRRSAVAVLCSPQWDDTGCFAFAVPPSELPVLAGHRSLLSPTRSPGSRPAPRRSVFQAPRRSDVLRKSA